MQAKIINAGVSMRNDKYSKAIGGYARAAKLTPEERSAIAQKAAKGRWDADLKIPKATHLGVIKLSGIEIPCAVLDDGTRVLSERSVAKALEKKGGGFYRQKRKRVYTNDNELLPEYVSVRNLEPFISPEIKKRLLNPISYNVKTGTSVRGIPSTLLPEICQIWLSAREKGSLTERQLETAAKAQILMQGFAPAGIVALVDEATGYQEVRLKDVLQAYLETSIAKELIVWAKKIPDEFYENIYKLKGWSWPGIKKNRFSVVARYTRDLVYDRIAPWLLKELEKKGPPDEIWNGPNRRQQWRSEDVGNFILAQHLYSLVMFQRLALSNNYKWRRFVKMVDKVLPKRGETS
ncbi:MAG: P63C domain-containing protein [Deltaproteobacteria bacterium]